MRMRMVFLLLMVMLCWLRLSLEGRVVCLLSFGELLEKGLRRVILERKCRLADGNSGRLLTLLFPFQVSFESVEEEAVMRDTVPVKHFLLLLSSYTVVLVEKVKESTLWFFEGCVCA